mmetsp:Transcript_75391/g.218945  ORF Transcript_75391/g.218945 Transcript_75391/m.218945 type:complete len:222 (+) Transcript_75391:366-1031(+)
MSKDISPAHRTAMPTHCPCKRKASEKSMPCASARRYKPFMKASTPCPKVCAYSKRSARYFSKGSEYAKNMAFALITSSLIAVKKCMTSKRLSAGNSPWKTARNSPKAAARSASNASRRSAGKLSLPSLSLRPRSVACSLRGNVFFRKRINCSKPAVLRMIRVKSLANSEAPRMLWKSSCPALELALPNMLIVLDASPTAAWTLHGDNVKNTSEMQKTSCGR